MEQNPNPNMNQPPYPEQNPNQPPYQNPGPGPNRGPNANPNLNGFYDLPPVKAAMSMIANVFNFEGRTARSDFWWAMLAVFCVEFVLNLLLGGMERIFISVGIMRAFFSILQSIVTLGLSLLTLAISVRRLHDTNKTGWLMLLALTIVGCIPLVIFWCTPGDQQPNQYGPVPPRVT